MSETSIQVRRITNRVKKFYELFGFRHFTTYNSGRAVIKGGKRLGFDEIECVVSDTSRGTSVGFYSINILQGLLFSIPWLFLLLLHLMARLSLFKSFLTGDSNFLSINFIKLLTGEASLSFGFVFAILILSIFPFVVSYAIQSIRVSNLKARFSFYTKNAVWETREAPNSLILLQSVRSALTLGYILAILFFAIFSFDTKTIGEVIALYRTNENDLRIATQTTFSITGGIIIGLISGDKAIKLRKQSASYDKRYRITGNLLERRLIPILHGVQAALYTSFILLIFLETTFYRNASFSVAVQLIIFAVFGSIIAGLIHQEPTIWMTSLIAVVIFFSAIFFIFQTGSNPEYAFLVILLLSLIPFPLLIHYSLQFRKPLEESGIESLEWMYEFVPLLGFLSLYQLNNRKKTVRKSYEARIEDEIQLSTLKDHQIGINKQIFENTSSPAYRLARHYFELLVSYTASFDEDAFVIIPTTSQLNKWWTNETKMVEVVKYHEMINFIDKLLWDTNFNPPEKDIISKELIAKEMAIALQ